MKINCLKTLALVALFGAVSTNASAKVKADDVIVRDGLVYTVTVASTDKANAKATFEGIAKESTKYDEALVIPASISYTDEGAGTTETIDVTEISANWTAAQATGSFVAPKSTKAFPEGIVSLTIKAPVATLPTIPATNMAKLTTLDIEGTKIATVANTTTNFPKLTTVKLPKELVEIAASSFKGFKGTSITLPETLKRIETEAFEGAALTSIAIPAKVTYIGGYAFNNNAALATLDLSKAAALEWIGSHAFTKTVLGKTSFKGCAALAEIKESAFEGVETFNAVLGGAKALKTIGASAFKGTATENANIASVETIGQSAFEGCEALKAIAITAVKGTLQNSVFKGCVALTKVVFGGEITEINPSAFEGCEHLATVDFSAAEKLENIWGLAFKGCAALKSVDLSATLVKKIKYASTYAGCTKLEEFIFPDGVTEIAQDAFKDTKIAELDLSKATIGLVNGNIFGTYTEEAPNKALKTLKLGDCNVKGFNYFEALETVEMGDGQVWYQAFANCTSLNSFTKGTGSVNQQAFVNDIALATFTMKAGVVEDNAFLNCTALKTFNYNEPANDMISVKAFLGCTPFVTINTTAAYVKAYPTLTGNTDKVLVPTNAKWGEGAVLKVKKTVKDNTGDKYYMYFTNTDDTNYAIFNKEDAKLYSIYVDEGVAYFQSVITSGGKYYVGPGEHVILKTDEAKEVEYVLEYDKGFKSTVLIDQVFHGDGNPLAAFQSNPSAYKYSDKTAVSYTNGKDYVYRLTNNANGFGFSFYAGENLNKGQFFIISDKKPASAGARLQTVWLDENGNVEGDATGIQQVDAAAEAQDGAIYNLQGVRVNAAKKGLYIQNGKKFIVK